MTSSSQQVSSPRIPVDDSIVQSSDDRVEVLANNATRVARLNELKLVASAGKQRVRPGVVVVVPCRWPW